MNGRFGDAQVAIRQLERMSCNERKAVPMRLEDPLFWRDLLQVDRPVVVRARRWRASKQADQSQRLKCSSAAAASRRHHM